MVLKYSPARTSPRLAARYRLRHFAVAGAALCGLTFSACEELTGEGDSNTDTAGSVSDVTGGTDTGTPVPGINPDAFRFSVLGGKTVAFGEVYEPMTAQGLKPFSFYMGTVGLVNSGSTPMKVANLELIPLGDTLDSEWTFRTSELEEAPIWEFEPFEIAPNTSHPISMRYFPQQTQVSQARLVVTDDKGDKADMIISARCRDAAFISPDVDVDWSFNWGHANSQSKLLAGGLATDSAGNSYISGNAGQWGDQFNTNIVVAAFNASGGVSWAKEWNEPFIQEQPDSGQNGQAGGNMTSIVNGGDSHIYVAGRRSTAQTNNTWQALILKIKQADGGLVWSKGWVPEADVDVGAEAYSLDASIADRVLFSGVVANQPGDVLFGAVSKDTGEPIFTYSILLGGVARGYAIAANAAGDAYVVGITGGGSGFLLRFTGCDTSEPTLAWAKTIGLGTGSSAHTVSMGSDGSAYVGFDVRGAATLFAFARFNKDGNLVWAKYYDERQRGDQHTQYAIKEVGDKVYVAGRIGLNAFDYTGGDGMIVRVSAADGSYDWANIYYTGTTASTAGDHRVKGFSFAGDKVHVLLSHWTGARNSTHYWGHWYSSYNQMNPEPEGKGEVFLGDFTIDAVDVTAAETTVITPITTGRAIDIDASSIWTAPPSAVKATPTGTMTGNGSHYTAVIQQLNLND